MHNKMGRYFKGSIINPNESKINPSRAPAKKDSNKKSRKVQDTELHLPKIIKNKTNWVCRQGFSTAQAVAPATAQASVALMYRRDYSRDSNNPLNAPALQSKFVY